MPQAVCASRPTDRQQPGPTSATAPNAPAAVASDQVARAMRRTLCRSNRTAGARYGTSERRVYVGPHLRTGSVCKLRLSVCRLDVFNVQFVDCMPHKSGLQTGIQSANCVNPVCKLDKSSFRGLVCKWEIKRNELLTATAQTMAEKEEQKRLFNEALQKQCGGEDKERSQFLTAAKYDELHAALTAGHGWGQYADGKAKKELQLQYQQIYAWTGKYALVQMAGSSIAHHLPSRTRPNPGCSCCS